MPILPLLALLQDAPAQPPADASGGLFGNMLIPLGLCLVVFWLLVLGPERKQRKKRDEMLKNIAKGDKVMTSGGLYGTVSSVQDDVVTLQVAEGVRLRFSRTAVQTVLADDQPAAAPSEKKPP